jgi:Domain of unknown function (DUF4410)
LASSWNNVVTLRSALLCLSAVSLVTVSAYAGDPLAAKVTITPVSSYTGNPLPKPEKILIYDFEVNRGDVQVDKVQSLRPRHLIMGDKSQDAVANSAGDHYYTELDKKLAKTGIPVEHMAAGKAPSANALIIDGSFSALKEGTKAERATIGMGTGSADFESKVKVHLKTASDDIAFLQFQTYTKPAPNVGGAVPVAAGLDPAAVAAKSAITDRKKTLNAYASQTADATAKQILKSMAAQGWVKLNDKGEVAE